MSAPFNRTALKRGSGIITIGGATLYPREDISQSFEESWKEVESSLHGVTDYYKSALPIKLSFLVYGLWQNLSVMFPSYLMNPSVGTSLPGGTDQPVVLWGKNNDRITLSNAYITKLTDLFLGVDSELFAGAIEITGILAKDAMPTDAGAYFVRDTSAYTETAFANTHFLKGRWTGAWGAKTGFGAISTQKGWNVSWDCDVQVEAPDGYGPMDLYVGKRGMIAGARCIPIGPTQPQIDTAKGTQSADIGTLLSSLAADLTLSGPSSAAVVLKGAGLTKDSTVFAIDKLRQGEIAFKTTRSFTLGVPSAVATVA